MVQVCCHDSPVIKKPKLNLHDNESVLTICSRTETLETSSSCGPTELKQITEPTSQAEVSGNTGAAEASCCLDVRQDGVNTPTGDAVSRELKQRTPAFKTDGLEDSLLCSICQDILYNCIRYFHLTFQLSVFLIISPAISSTT